MDDQCFVLTKLQQLQSQLEQQQQRQKNNNDKLTQKHKQH